MDKIVYSYFLVKRIESEQNEAQKGLSHLEETPEFFNEECFEAL